MQYNFDRIIDRKSTNDIKWHAKVVSQYLNGAPVKEDMIPMWVADTEFACYEGIVNSIKNRADKEIFGYCGAMPRFYNAIKFWYETRFNWQVKEEWIDVLPTVVAGINIAIRAFSNEGDGVIIQQPVYDPFSKIIVNSNRKIVNNAIKLIDGKYTIDFKNLEELAKNPENKAMVLCSPHNPMGIVWSKEDLCKIADICLENNVMIISDEIHADIIYKGNTHYPLLAINEKYADNFILLASPSKTFNVAGLKTAFSIIPNSEIKAKFVKTQISLSLDIKNTFGLEAVEACYTTEGSQWVDEQVEYMASNVEFLENFIKEKMPKVTMVKPQGSFLCWLDFSALGIPDNQLLQKLLFDANVACVPGNWFGPGGENHLRINIGCPRSILEEAINRICTSVYN